MSLDEEDQNWLRAEFGKVIQAFDRLDVKLDQVGTRLDKVDIGLDQLSTRLAKVGAKLDQVDTRLDQVDVRPDQVDIRLDELEETFGEKLEQMETKLLTEFHKWAGPTDQRLRAGREIAGRLTLN